MIKRFNANRARLKRHQRIRNRIVGSDTRPRLNVFRSGHHIYAQVIDDTTGNTLVSASSLDEALRDFKPKAPEQPAASTTSVTAETPAAEAAASAVAAKGKGAKAEKPQAKGGQPQAKGGQPQKSGKQQTAVKTLLPAAQKGQAKTPVEALVAIANNRKVATAREVGKLVAQRAQEKGVKSVVFDRGGYAYHGRVAALAEGAREGGLNF